MRKQRDVEPESPSDDNDVESIGSSGFSENSNVKSSSMKKPSNQKKLQSGFVTISENPNGVYPYTFSLEFPFQFKSTPIIHLTPWVGAQYKDCLFICNILSVSQTKCTFVVTKYQAPSLIVRRKDEILENFWRKLIEGDSNPQNSQTLDKRIIHVENTFFRTSTNEQQSIQKRKDWFLEDPNSEDTKNFDRKMKSWDFSFEVAWLGLVADEKNQRIPLNLLLSSEFEKNGSDQLEEQAKNLLSSFMSLKSNTNGKNRSPLSTRVASSSFFPEKEQKNKSKFANRNYFDKSSMFKQFGNKNQLENEQLQSRKQKNQEIIEESEWVFKFSHNFVAGLFWKDDTPFLNVLMTPSTSNEEEVFAVTISKTNHQKCEFFLTRVDNDLQINLVRTSLISFKQELERKFLNFCWGKLISISNSQNVQNIGLLDGIRNIFTSESSFYKRLAQTESIQKEISERIVNFSKNTQQEQISLNISVFTPPIEHIPQEFKLKTSSAQKLKNPSSSNLKSENGEMSFFLEGKLVIGHSFITGSYEQKESDQKFVLESKNKFPFQLPNINSNGPYAAIERKHMVLLTTPRIDPTVSNHEKEQNSKEMFVVNFDSSPNSVEIPSKSSFFKQKTMKIFTNTSIMFDSQKIDLFFKNSLDPFVNFENKNNNDNEKPEIRQQNPCSWSQKCLACVIAHCFEPFAEDNQPQAPIPVVANVQIPHSNSFDQNMLNYAGNYNYQSNWPQNPYPPSQPTYGVQYPPMMPSQMYFPQQQPAMQPENVPHIGNYYYPPQDYQNNPYVNNNNVMKYQNEQDLEQKANAFSPILQNDNLSMLAGAIPNLNEEILENLIPYGQNPNLMLPDQQKLLDENEEQDPDESCSNVPNPNQALNVPNFVDFIKECNEDKKNDSFVASAPIRYQEEPEFQEIPKGQVPNSCFDIQSPSAFTFSELSPDANPNHQGFNSNFNFGFPLVPYQEPVNEDEQNPMSISQFFQNSLKNAETFALWDSLERAEAKSVHLLLLPDQVFKQELTRVISTLPDQTMKNANVKENEFFMSLYKNIFLNLNKDIGVKEYFLFTVPQIVQICDVLMEENSTIKKKNVVNFAIQHNTSQFEKTLDYLYKTNQKKQNSGVKNLPFAPEIQIDDLFWIQKPDLEIPQIANIFKDNSLFRFEMISKTCEGISKIREFAVKTTQVFEQNQNFNFNAVHSLVEETLTLRFEGISQILSFFASSLTKLQIMEIIVKYLPISLLDINGRDRNIDLFKFFQLSKHKENLESILQTAQQQR